MKCMQSSISGLVCKIGGNHSYFENLIENVGYLDKKMNFVTKYLI